MLEDKIKVLRRRKGLLLMPHLVLGFPSYEENRKLIHTMVEAGADIIEMQIPFSEPMADGPVIVRANDLALRNGANTTKSLAFAAEVCAEFPETLFVFMTYANIPFVYGMERFVEKSAAIGIKALIIPDLPPEEGADYLEACKKTGVDPIFLFTPTSTPQRLKTLSQHAKGMAYCVGRKGVTGIKTTFDQSLKELIQKYRKATTLPLALGFGIQEKQDFDALRDDVDMAVIGTKVLTLHEEKGASAVGEFLKAARE